MLFIIVSVILNPIHVFILDAFAVVSLLYKKIQDEIKFFMNLHSSPSVREPHSYSPLFSCTWKMFQCSNHVLHARFFPPRLSVSFLSKYVVNSLEQKPFYPLHFLFYCYRIYLQNLWCYNIRFAHTRRLFTCDKLHNRNKRFACGRSRNPNL